MIRLIEISNKPGMFSFGTRTSFQPTLRAALRTAVYGAGRNVYLVEFHYEEG